MFKIIHRLRKRAISIESVMLGMVAVLAMAGALYFAFERIQELNTRQKYFDFLFQYKSMMQTAAKSQSYTLAEDSTLDFTKFHENHQAMIINQAVASDRDLFPAMPGMFVVNRNSLVPYGGSLNTVSYGGVVRDGGGTAFRRAGFILSWSSSGLYGAYNETKARRLCHYFAEHQAYGYLPDPLKSASFRSGPLGDDYQIAQNGCNSATPSIFFLFKF